MNCETCTLLKHLNFCAENIDEEWDLLEWLARILTNLRLVVLIFAPHPPASLIMPPLIVRFAIVLVMTMILA